MACLWLSLFNRLRMFAQPCSSPTAKVLCTDIKPSNLFIVESTSAIRSTKVVDFGIARLNVGEGANEQGLTRPGEVFGSPLYMSPEQNKALNDLIARCMEKAAAQRFKNVAEIAEQLSKISTATSERKLSYAKENSNRSARENDINSKLGSDLDDTSNNSKKNLLVPLAIGIALIVTAGAVIAALALNNKSNSEKTSLAKTADSKSISSDNSDTSSQETRQANNLTSQVVLKNGRSQRIFTFPPEAVGVITTNQKKRQREGDDTAAQGTVIWPNAEPIRFTAATEIDNYPSTFNGFDNKAIVNLTLKKLTKLPPILVMEKWNNLQTLTFRRCHLDAAYTEGLGRLPHLRNLTFDETEFDAKALNASKILTKLRSVQTDAIKDHTLLLEGLSNSLELKHLELRQLALRTRDLKLLAELPNLVTLDLRSSILPADAFTEISALPSLQFLCIEDAVYKPDALMGLGKCKTLKHLHIGSNNLDQQTVNRFHKNYPKIKIYREK
ncbi:hypothetical protein BH11CYA1_BH11CYA1_00760 [soil metagenome]